MRWFFIGLLFVLAGCATPKTEMVYVTEHEYITYEIPSKLLTQCKPHRLMSNEEYSKLNSSERETALVNHIVYLYGEIKKCDNKIKAIDNYVDRMNKVYALREDK